MGWGEEDGTRFNWDCYCAVTVVEMVFTSVEVISGGSMGFVRWIGIELIV